MAAMRYNSRIQTCSTSSPEAMLKDPARNCTATCALIHPGARCSCYKQLSSVAYLQIPHTCGATLIHADNDSKGIIVQGTPNRVPMACAVLSDDLHTRKA